MTVETQILHYLNSLHPAVSFSMLHVNKIMHIVESPTAAGTGTVKLYRYNGMTDGYQFIRTLHADDETIKAAVLNALESSQPRGGYMYECHNSAGEFEGKIYSLNPELF